MTQKLQPQKEIEVDGEKYIVQLYGPTFGLSLYAKLLRLLGEPIVKLIGMMKGAKLDGLLDFDLKDLDTDAAGEALQSLFSKLSDEELPELMKEILSQTFTYPALEVVTKNFETQFAGKYLHLFKLVAQTVGVQYGDFLSGIVKRSSAGKGVKTIAKKATETDET